MANSETNRMISDKTQLREAQYRDSGKLKARANIHKYGTSPIGWFEWVAREAALPAGAKVLEVGCGPGWLWAQGAAGFPSDLSLTLTDLSPGMVAEALERVGGLDRYAAVTAREADASSLPFADGRFEAVLACHMLYHLPDPGRALDEMIRVLRPGGMIVVTTNGEDNMGELYALGGRAFGGADRDPSAVAFGIEAAEAVMRARLSEVTTSIYRDELRITDGEDIVGTLTSYPPGEDASEAQVEALREMVAERMAADGGVFRTSKRVGLVRGVRR
jgi:SAM-dependent methyltransferase